jgi:hypothetical protein
MSCGRQRLCVLRTEPERGGVRSAVTGDLLAHNVAFD